MPSVPPTTKAARSFVAAEIEGRIREKLGVKNPVALGLEDADDADEVDAQD